MTTEWDLVCERVALKTLAKLILFTGSLLYTEAHDCTNVVSHSFKIILQLRYREV